MWICSKCGEQQEDQFDACWKCNVRRSGEPVSALPEPEKRPSLQCVRCEAKLDYVGTKRFHEGARWGVLGDLGELFVNRESFDIFVCPACGRVEFFVEGIGEELRPSLKERGAWQLLSQASRLEAKGQVQEALVLYEQAATQYVDTEAGRDALRSIEDLRKELE